MLAKTLYAAVYNLVLSVCLLYTYNITQVIVVFIIEIEYTPQKHSGFYSTVNIDSVKNFQHLPLL